MSSQGWPTKSRVECSSKKGDSIVDNNLRIEPVRISPAVHACWPPSQELLRACNERESRRAETFDASAEQTVANVAQVEQGRVCWSCRVRLKRRQTYMAAPLAYSLLSQAARLTQATSSWGQIGRASG